MSERFFDDLARTLARPMPRRRAVRVLGTALLMAAVPGVSARAALARTESATCEPNTFECKCPNKDLFFRACCPTNVPGTRYTCECFPDRAQCTARKVCPPGSRACGTDCCEPYENCVGGECECNERCGKICCGVGATCKSEARSLCCSRNWRVCEAGSAGAVKCCPPKDQCCFKSGTTKVQCCGPEQDCDPATGNCPCKKRGQVSCGSECCDRETEVCASGRSSQGKPFKKCCPRGKVLCAGACCDPRRCVREFEGEGKVCCPPERLLALGTMSMCCPPGKRSTGGLCR
jgi:hypothetical protein